ncbi:hypothetical protein ACHQM5_029041 [Ranunculus cassubicifolius]
MNMKIATAFIMLLALALCFLSSPAFATRNAAFEILRDNMLALPSNCVGQGEPCGALDWCCDPYYCYGGPFKGRCKLCAAKGEACGRIPCCAPYRCVPAGFGGVCG